MTRMALSPKQLEALSTLTGPAALDGSLSFEDVLRAVLLLCPDEHVPRVFVDRMVRKFDPQVVIGIADVARLLLAQGEHIEALRDEVAEWRSGKCSDDNKYVEVKTLADDLRAALAYETGHCGGDIDDDGHYQELGRRCRQVLGPIVPAKAKPWHDEEADWKHLEAQRDADLSLPPESLDGRTQPVDATERDPVEVSTFGVGRISPEAESMRRGEVS